MPTTSRRPATALAGTLLIVGATGVASAATPAPATPATATPATATPAARQQAACADAAPGQLQCLAMVNTAVRPAAAGELPAGYGAADIEAAYSLPIARGSGQTIAVVDAYDNPNAEADLAVYRQTYGLPACTTANGCFHKLDQRGGTDYPFADPSWGLEISLDLDMVSAGCPQCHIVLVEADSASVDDLAAAEDTAAALDPAAISNSFGGNEFTGMDQYADDFRHSGTTTVASTGDIGFTAASFPAVLPGVIAVGGTSLYAADNTRGWTEHAWSGAGSGCSAWIAKPAWQQDKHCDMRTVADVSALADPATGAAVYDTVPYNGRAGWFVVGGTSAASPIIAAVVGLAGNGHTLSPAFPYRHRRFLNDVAGGSNATPYENCGGDYLCVAKKGYDGPTGLGTPNGTGAF